jgi:cardiolipin-specific phospholipase
MMYGENDWMDIAGGHAAEKKLQDEKARVLKGLPEEEKKKDKGDAKVLIIKRAGHHLYLEGYEEFNEVMRKEMEETQRASKAEAK